VVVETKFVVEFVRLTANPFELNVPASKVKVFEQLKASFNVTLVLAQEMVIGQLNAIPLFVIVCADREANVNVTRYHRRPVAGRAKGPRVLRSFNSSGKGGTQISRHRWFRIVHATAVPRCFFYTVARGLILR
jgi:hypothetical protein